MRQMKCDAPEDSLIRRVNARHGRQGEKYAVPLFFVRSPGTFTDTNAYDNKSVLALLRPQHTHTHAHTHTHSLSLSLSLPLDALVNGFCNTVYFQTSEIFTLLETL